MTLTPHKQMLLKQLPGVDTLVDMFNQEKPDKDIPKSVIVAAARCAISCRRDHILSSVEEAVQDDHFTETDLIEEMQRLVDIDMTPNLRYVVNATGVVVHTNLGRSLLAPDTIKAIGAVAGNYSNLEFDLDAGKRGSRYTAVEDLLCDICGCEAAMVVNNNAGAVLLCLDTLSSGREAIVSRGELVEIGGAFRIPDVMMKSRTILREVGTTNRTHLKDYHNAITDDTALLLKVHTSNYAIVGFTKSVALEELVALGRDKGIPVMEDLGSGMFVDFSRYGLPKEPTVQESLRAGTDLVTFSGDKLLGGPQAGIITGKKQLIEKIRTNPLTRALRIDKLTLAGLEHTLRLYRDEQRAIREIPTLRMLTMPFNAIAHKAQQLATILNSLENATLEVSLIDTASKAGGGALPMLNLPTKCVGIAIQGMSANKIETHMRGYTIPVIGRIENDIFVMDMRTVMENEFDLIKNCVISLLSP